MRKLLLLSPLLAIIFLSLINTPASKTSSQLTTQPIGKNSAAIKGIVTTSGGEPVSKAMVSASRLGSSEMRTRRNAVTTDDQGRFSLSNLPDGEYTIRAYKEEDGYPDLTFSFYSEAYNAVHWPQITIVNGTTVEDVIVHLAGPKGGRLLITVVDAETNKKIREAQVSLTHAGNPKTLLISGANRSDYSFNLLVPPDVVVDLKVSAPGYRVWHYNADRPGGETKTLRLAPDTTKELNVSLQPQK
ncbi:MAG: carboxypeptidase-like regulatory domain-containing protein [Acidobacteria bacterium]|nr:carboxypeptidase-like regulatory domain-containing protein [Acidobacteriota bacterium]